ncbi:hypothetical protein [Pelomonas sp. KK5]|uniref:hypothetical protein n=1 Tax=Pelomonas sp. KK5 TaxID=1855730 RepID=UPI00097C74DA|nr:hypothetical protein [Pelomonas sp. KK5]
MFDHLIPRKTDAARALLQQPAARQRLAPGLRMLLITIDGRRSFAELRSVAAGLGLVAPEAFEQLRAAALVAWGEEQAQAAVPTPPTNAERAARLVRAKFFALDLAARMLAGRDQPLRERAREVDSESRFQAWLEECAAAIAQAGDAQRAALFLERVAASA